MVMVRPVNVRTCAGIVLLGISFVGRLGLIGNRIGISFGGNDSFVASLRLIFSRELQGSISDTYVAA
jgi:hypothetical protein